MVRYIKIYVCTGISNVLFVLIDVLILAATLLEASRAFDVRGGGSHTPAYIYIFNFGLKRKILEKVLPMADFS